MKELSKRLAQGDLEAYNAIFEKYYSPLCSYANKYLKDSEAAQDVVASLFMTLWENRSLQITDIGSYLTKAVHNRCVNKLKSILSRKLREEKFVYAMLNGESAELPDHIEHQIDKEQIEKIVENVSDTLPAKCKEIYTLHHKGELTQNEIAQKLEISVGTVKTQIHRANKKIAQELQKYLFSLFF